jgi:valyl-tRNA synthetase
VLERVLALLHPVMPFVTEEIWAYLPGERGLLMQSAFPEPDVAEDAEAARAVSAVIELVTELRRMRQDAGLGPREPLELAVSGGEDAAHLRAQSDLLAGLGRATIVDATIGGVPVVVGDARVLVGGGALALALRGKLERRAVEARGELAKAQGKLANAGFVDRAPAAVVAEERERAERLGREVDGLEARLAELAG